MEINLASRRILSSLPLGVPPDLKSGVKKCPNLLMLCGFEIRSKGGCFPFVVVGGLQIPRFNRSNLFLRRIANPPGRLAGDFMERLAGFKSAEILAGDLASRRM